MQLLSSRLFSKLFPIRWLSIFLALYMVTAPAISKTNEKAKVQAVRILVVGDSLSAEYGLKRGSGWVALLESRLAESVNWNEKPRKNAKNKKNATNNIANNSINTSTSDENSSKIRSDFTVINASISGDTTSGGRSRLAPLIDLHHPTHVIIELGANDALRGLPVAKTEENLTVMTQTALKSGAKVLLVGIQIPPNYGAEFTKQFAATFPKVAAANNKANNVGLVPFMLTGVADSPEFAKLFQADRIHPTEAAQAQILNNIWPELQKQLKNQATIKKPNTK
jgi:acyl-CoA thioesterase I